LPAAQGSYRGDRGHHVDSRCPQRDRRLLTRPLSREACSPPQSPEHPHREMRSEPSDGLDTIVSGRSGRSRAWSTPCPYKKEATFLLLPHSTVYERKARSGAWPRSSPTTSSSSVGGRGPVLLWPHRETDHDTVRPWLQNAGAQNEEEAERRGANREQECSWVCHGCLLGRFPCGSRAFSYANPMPCQSCANRSGDGLVVLRVKSFGARIRPTPDRSGCVRSNPSSMTATRAEGSPREWVPLDLVHQRAPC
jgi:hypothetical protein